MGLVISNIIIALSKRHPASKYLKKGVSIATPPLTYTVLFILLLVIQKNSGGSYLRVGRASNDDFGVSVVCLVACEANI